MARCDGEHSVARGAHRVSYVLLHKDAVSGPFFARLQYIHTHNAPVYCAQTKAMDFTRDNLASGCHEAINLH